MVNQKDETGTVEDYSSQGFNYERLWGLCIKFGSTDLTLPIKGIILNG